LQNEQPRPKEGAPPRFARLPPEFLVFFRRRTDAAAVKYTLVFASFKNFQMNRLLAICWL
jgi:hypothetical protein